ncbi:hypothetical protein TTHERM_000936630 (macronuclear) [Tetrahymena thermophila SB210]|uniref:Uncharacterized protein n=1 Tax=Tetrahymena thermophila (strain SB210) TaxID=312017 RepID=W7X7K5_TETTS|nr:hypothetical protein TTHERM_000936630 [Tetrahymena thermophila SB210]EWS73332.1 hypothetical protein TTHERM_000936630 [Tetrahymena thermophila SB210]|eukprot:XP_012654137.1 hypothetical protein TTHERM_000936630 [Tetrahymena thermophila SB210]
MSLWSLKQQKLDQKSEFYHISLQDISRLEQIECLNKVKKIFITFDSLSKQKALEILTSQFMQSEIFITNKNFEWKRTFNQNNQYQTLTFCDNKNDQQDKLIFEISNINQKQVNKHTQICFVFYQIASIQLKLKYLKIRCLQANFFISSILTTIRCSLSKLKEPFYKQFVSKSRQRYCQLTLKWYFTICLKIKYENQFQLSIKICILYSFKNVVNSSFFLHSYEFSYNQFFIQISIIVIL